MSDKVKESLGGLIPPGYTGRTMRDAEIELAQAPGSRFPMLDGPTIDWHAAREIYRVYSCVHGTEQTLERLAERGGFGWSEVTQFYQQHQKQKCLGHCRCANDQALRPER